MLIYRNVCQKLVKWVVTHTDLENTMQGNAARSSSSEACETNTQCLSLAPLESENGNRQKNILLQA